MKITALAIPDVLLLEPRVFADERGFFFESYNESRFTELTGLKPHFVQDNHSRSSRGVLRGLHYQLRQPQSKLVRVLAGEVFDVAVDVRRGSPNFGKHVATLLSAENKRQVWIPEGFAHGFLVLSDTAELLYKSGDYYSPQWERCLRWDDPSLAIAWPLSGPPVLSARDAVAPLLSGAELPG